MKTDENFDFSDNQANNGSFGNSFRDLAAYKKYIDSQNEMLDFKDTIIYMTQFIAPDEIIISHPDFFRNALEFEGDEKKDFCFDDFLRRLHPEELPLFKQFLNDIFNFRTKGTTGLFRLLNKKGDYVWFFGSASVIGIDEMTDFPVLNGFIRYLKITSENIPELSIFIKSLKRYVYRDELDKLSLTEKKIGIMISDGLKNVEIAKNLNISINTLNHYKKNLFIKTNTRNAASLTRYFWKTGLI